MKIKLKYGTPSGCEICYSPDTVDVFSDKTKYRMELIFGGYTIGDDVLYMTEDEYWSALNEFLELE